MEKSYQLDIQKLNNIIRYITNIKKCFEQHDISNLNNFKNDEIVQAACTQFITNIYADKNKLQDETCDLFTIFNKINLTGARNIASHDYESLNFKVIYSICLTLIKSSTLADIYRVLSEIEKTGGFETDD